METNTLPVYDKVDNPTGCCPRFNPEGWDHREFHFHKKPFVKAVTRSLFHIPINMGTVYPQTYKKIADAGKSDGEQFAVLTREISPWRSEHYFAVTGEVPGEEMAYLSGEFHTRVFEGPYKMAGRWHNELYMEMKNAGKTPHEIYFFYTTCPKCAKYYGKNYVVGFAKTKNTGSSLK